MRFITRYTLMIVLLGGAMAMGLGSREGLANNLVTITGTVLAAPPCVINSDTIINVDFGDDLVTTKIDGMNYLREVPYTLVCNGLASNALQMRILGSGAGFDTTILGTNKVTLGIELRQARQKLNLNSPFNFTYPNVPVLQAVPVKLAGIGLTSGAFSASATLLVDYQ